jgi:hypothetical protein
MGMMGGMMNMMGGNWDHMDDFEDMMGDSWGHMGGMMNMMHGSWGHMGTMMDQFGPGEGMMGAWNPPTELAPTGETLTLDEAVEIAEAYIEAWDSETPLELGEVMEFSNHFYAMAREQATGRGVFEFLIDPTDGAVFAEPGPNMMWNLRFGMSGYGLGLSRSAYTGEDMDISLTEAQELAQMYLDDVLPDTQADPEGDLFYGYYTLHVLRDGNIVGMLSVNGYTGQVWLHQWHGDFVGMTAHSPE